MLRSLLAPRWWGVHLLAVAAVVGMLLMATWQWQRAEAGRRSGPTPDDPAAVALSALHEVGSPLPEGAVGRRVLLEGRYDAEHQFLVPDRSLDGRVGLWVLTPLLTDGGAGVVVVRGWVSSPADPATAVPDGTVAVSGRLQRSETRETGTALGESLPDGQVQEVSPATLVSLVPYPLHDGYLALSEQTPSAAVAPTPIPDAPPAARPGEFRLQNYAYALQWVLFAGFAVFLWWRTVRDATRRAEPEEEQVASPA